MKKINKLLEKTMKPCLDGIYAFNGSTVSVMSSENIWGDMYECYRTEIEGAGVTAYIAIGGHYAAGYFKTDGQNFCISTFYEKDGMCYTGRVLLGWNLNDVYNNVKTMLRDISVYNEEGNAPYSFRFNECMSWQKAINGELVSTIEKRKEEEKLKAETEAKAKANPENALLVKILAIAKSKNSDCYCSESRDKFAEIAKLISEEKPELV